MRAITPRGLAGRSRAGLARTPRRLPNTAIATVTVLALCSGTWLIHDAARGHAPPQPSAAQALDARAARDPGAAALPPSPPERVRIPALRVDAPLTGLGLTPTGSLDAPPPTEGDLAGWYEAGTAPGATGTAIVAGHVDTARGPAVFHRLGALRKGARIEVDRKDGTVVVFSVDAVEVYDARAFPDDRVYGAARRPELRVITCGGGWSERTGYRGNVVVFAHLTDSRPARAGIMRATARTPSSPPG
jgi:hypothetical protein